MDNVLFAVKDGDKGLIRVCHQIPPEKDRGYNVSYITVKSITKANTTSLDLVCPTFLNKNPWESTCTVCKRENPRTRKIYSFAIEILKFQKEVLPAIGKKYPELLI